MFKHIFLMLIGISFYASFSSCKKIINVDLPPNEITAVSVFSDSATAVAADLGMYVNLINGEKINIAPLMAYVDELTPLNAGTEPAIFYTSVVPPTDATVSSIWRYFYSVIYQANDIINRVPNSATLSMSLKSRLTGEALFCRAYSYFYLINCYGNVPLVLTTDLDATSMVSRSDSATIYTQIIKDLRSSEGCLQGSYSGEELVRPTKWAAASLLSRVFLYSKDYIHADSAASVVINSGVFTLAPLNSAFAKTSSELILSLNSSTGYTLGSTFIPATNTSKPSYFIDTVLLAAFDSADQRRTAWLGTTTYSGTIYPYPYKYKARSASSQPNGPEYYILFRLAEQYLIRAEAKENENDIANAIEDLNTLHTRAGLPAYNSNVSPTMCDSLIQHERRVELFTENNHRFFDLKRTGLINPVMSALKPTGWQERAVVLPIPSNELLLNPKLSQNPGYSN